MHERTGLPHDHRLERTVLALSLHEDDHRQVLVDELVPDDFYVDINRKAFEAVSRLHRQLGDGFSRSTLASVNHGDPAIGALLADDYGFDPRYLNVEQYEGALRRLRELSESREIARCCADVYVSGTSSTATSDPASFIDEATQRLTAALERRRSNQPYRAFSDVVRPILADMVSGKAYTPRIVAPSGISSVDRSIRWRGFGSGELTVIMGRPGMGKTAIGMQIARHNAVAGLNTAVFSYETSHEDLALSVLAADAGIPLREVTGNVSSATAARASKHAELLDGMPLYLFDCPGLKFEDFAVACRAMKRKGKLDLIVVDYLQKMSFRQRFTERREELSAVANGLKNIARELDVPVIALAQPNREADKRADKRPTMADIGGSSAIEQDADRIIGLYRECQYDANADEHSAEAIFLKNRKARIGMVRLRFEGETGTFSDWGQP